MKQILLLGIVLLCAARLSAQYSIQLSIQKKQDSLPLAGATATLSAFNKKAIADGTGIVTFNNLSAGNYKVVVSYVGLQEAEINVTLPLLKDTTLQVLLEETEEDEEEVVVTATRSSRSIKDLPTRVETISGEELAEKANMKPGDIRMLLNESTGIQTQQTSATSYNSSIRIQGLDGRYTQVLRDGLPLYAGFSGGLSLMQVPPLDLKQVEVIKGSSSTLYGGGAIAGLVNLVSKTPTDKNELSFIANATSAKGLDLSGFYNQRFKKTGLTIFAARNTNAAYDPANNGLTAIPKCQRYTFVPKIFFYGKKTTLSFGVNYITEDRLGGSMDFIKNGMAGYFEKNETKRFTSQLDIRHKLSANTHLEFKNSVSKFHRLITIPSYAFEGSQLSSYSELTINIKQDKLFWTGGVNFLTDDFKEKQHNADALRNYNNNTLGFFVQNTWTPIGKFSLESGIRADYVNQYGIEILPRISAMVKLTPKLTARIGGGMGYKTPSVFTEEAERIQFQSILPIDASNTRNETSIGTNLDFNYRTNLGRLGITINQLFFYTKLERPLLLTNANGGKLNFKNSNGHIDTRGLETNLRFTYSYFKLFVGYTYADVNTHFNSVKAWLPLTPKHRLNNVLTYEKPGKIKIGLEAYYYSPQQLSDGATGKQYWICGAMAEKPWKRFSLFINFENIFDVRQTRFDSIYTGSITNPVFRDIYAPVDGFVINGGIKLKW